MSVITKKFRSTSGKTVRVTSEGRVALVPTDWKVLPSCVWAAAYAAGCESEDMVVGKGNSVMSKSEQKLFTGIVDKKIQIRNAILQLLEENDIDKFTYYRARDEYKPNTKELVKILGFQISNAERDAVLYKILEEGVSLPEFDK